MKNQREEEKNSSGESSESLKTSEVESTHTRGPWMTRYNGAYGHLIIGGDNGGNIVATVHLKDAYKTTEQGSANARLISAAPSLYYAALLAAHELRVELDLRPRPLGSLRQQVLDELDAALALANTPVTNTSASDGTTATVPKSSSVLL